MFNANKMNMKQIKMQINEKSLLKEMYDTFEFNK